MADCSICPTAQEKIAIDAKGGKTHGRILRMRNGSDLQEGDVDAGLQLILRRAMTRIILLAHL
jgi:hypothetical protein